jgi:cell division protein FtsL
MNGFAGFMGRTLRGVRLVEFGALMVLLVMATGVYLAKAAAGRERADITTVQTQIDEENKRLRLLQAEVAHLEEPERLVTLSAQIGLAPTDGKHQGAPEDLAQIATAALLPEKPGKKSPTLLAQVSTQAAADKTGAPQ